MPRRSDSKTRMIAAARRLYRERGYVATAFSDVLEESAAPRGSVYFHFPGGKQELGTEVALLHASDTIAQINRSALRFTTAAEMVGDFIDQAKDRVLASDFREGCPVAAIIVETASSPGPLSDTTRRGLQDVLTVFAARMTEKGLPAEEAESLAVATIAAMEGALVVARGLRDVAPFDVLRETLTGRARDSL
ncbi:TetR/AcrR family transcriptional regulator [Pseudonocardia spinosispora]|uniref:TetR/AcrR family transcriptional regulator n=1 Tax=Pseudonocardia spinosispora TaxID=103441 RepID=UPI00048D77A8|nr:TetR/AcrR family transcriptional regulator [Pseudonocardia spinosispora]